MKRTLYIKFLLAYLLFGIFGFIVVATFVYSMTLDRLRRDKADNMYQVATQIANTYAADLYNSETSLETVHGELSSLSKYMDNSPIWIVNPSGRLVLDSSRMLEPGKEIVITGFDPTITGSSYYTTGDFWSSFNQEMLSVFAPITANYKVQAYVVIVLHLLYIDIVHISAYCQVISAFFLNDTGKTAHRLQQKTSQYQRRDPPGCRTRTGSRLPAHSKSLPLLRIPRGYGLHPCSQPADDTFCIIFAAVLRDFGDHHVTFSCVAPDNLVDLVHDLISS